MKVSSHADILQKVSSNSTLEDITVLLKTYEDDKKLYTPAKGLYWLQKGTKQLVSLKSEQDLQTCKEFYKGNLRLACHTVSLETPGICFVLTCFPAVVSFRKTFIIYVYSRSQHYHDFLGWDIELFYGNLVYFLICRYEYIFINIKEAEALLCKANLDFKRAAIFLCEFKTLVIATKASLPVKIYKFFIADKIFL